MTAVTLLNVCMNYPSLLDDTCIATVHIGCTVVVLLKGKD